MKPTVQVCIACLDSETKLVRFNMDTYVTYNTLIGIDLSSDLPGFLCYICDAYMKKFIEFKEKCHKALNTFLALKKLSKQNTDNTKEIKEHKLPSSLSYLDHNKSFFLGYEEKDYEGNKPKQEPIVNCITPMSIIVLSNINENVEIFNLVKEELQIEKDIDDGNINNDSQKEICGENLIENEEEESGAGSVENEVVTSSSQKTSESNVEECDLDLVKLEIDDYDAALDLEQLTNDSNDYYGEEISSNDLLLHSTIAAKCSDVDVIRKEQQKLVQSFLSINNKPESSFVAKTLRNFGLPYVSSTNKIISERKIKPPCAETCRFKCSQKISESQRKVIFKNYWNLDTKNEKRLFISKCLSTIEKLYDTTNRRNKATHAYHFTIGDQEYRVCLLFFANTLGISMGQIKTVYDKMAQGLLSDSHKLLKKQKKIKSNKSANKCVKINENIKVYMNKRKKLKSDIDDAVKNEEIVVNSEPSYQETTNNQHLRDIKANDASITQKDGVMSENVCKTDFDKMDTDIDLSKDVPLDNSQVNLEKEKPYDESTCTSEKVNNLDENKIPFCIQHCQLKCTEMVTEAFQKYIYRYFWNLTSIYEQSEFIAKSVGKVKFKKHNNERVKKVFHRYYFHINNQERQVCSQFFATTLRISRIRIKKVLDLMPDENIVLDEKSGVCLNVYNRLSSRRLRKRKKTITDQNQRKIELIGENHVLSFLNLDCDKLPENEIDSKQKILLSVVNSKPMGPPCTEKCKLKCSKRITEDSRKILHKYFCKLHLSKKRAFIASCLSEVKPKYQYKQINSNRRANQSYSLVIDGAKHRVCQKMFISTLGVTERTIRTTIDKKEQGDFSDLRGKHKKQKKMQNNLTEYAEHYIKNNIPKITHKGINYIDGQNALILYDNYKKHCEQKGLGYINIWMFRIYLKNNNIKFLTKKESKRMKKNKIF